MSTLWLCFLLCVFSSQQLLSCSQHQAYVKEQLQQIPSQDKQALTLYFETLLTNNFAYTLFGDKPVSLDDYVTAGVGRSMKNAVLRSGKQVWDRHSHLFPSEKFIFVFRTKGDFEDICLINKPAFLDTVSRYIADFQQVLGQDITAEQLLAQLCKNDTTYEQALQGHEGLMGMLYGFGRANASLCYKLHQLGTAAEKWLQPPFSFLSDDISDAELILAQEDPFGYFKNEGLAYAPAELQAIFKEYDLYRSTMKDFPDDEDALCLSSLCLFALPSFGAILDHPETIALKEHYTKTRLTIMQAYSQGDFLEVTLCKLLEK